ncbi:Cation efflux protein family and Cation efflux protein transmembrane domain and Cation efflux protein cytoplasmic domain-containing protein [Strongyloides ratti]|uniref:Cation efflux protein family and Cation efflux protein transmembrane domain and Cation efflux protein cytoplasmic domain-containing protein n=1 Tax=Strongyloides ratti TaxID=34506 RepID=A0A090MS89_STRRB|nr:Cation efflux protein family and Cation efflux protein transmembrane domain and Cation efflux protein cytoplasmic domain-containing protein [Strongyloides ratti]CEF61118.1 Cation efflux protein family and Cation efflux protein transmembrane domain and Cation efflux protein cytoplasmic domain-containing protein [Strongyloides ratti]
MQREILYAFKKDLQNSIHITHVKKIKCEDLDAISKKKFDNYISKFSLSINVTRLFLNLIASIVSGSYSVISTLVDASLDLTTGGIIYLSNVAITNTNNWFYPRGRQRLEILSGIICAVIMGIANCMMILNSFQAILTNTIHINVDKTTVGIMLFGILSKFLLWIVCKTHDTPTSRVLTLDLQNDVFTNVVALCGAYFGTRYWSLADPIGAIIVCSWIVSSWISTFNEQIPLLVGGQIEQQHYNRIINLCINHDERIKCLDHLMVYHIGSKVQIELHIVMDENLPLKVTHDITEGLTHKLSNLDFVERVFIHCDYKVDGD